MLNKILLIATLSIQANAADDTVWGFSLATTQWHLYEGEFKRWPHDGSIAGQLCRVPDAIGHEIFADVNSGELVLLMMLPHQWGRLEIEGQIAEIEFEINEEWKVFLLREPGSESMYRRLEQGEPVTIHAKNEPYGNWIDLSMDEKTTPLYGRPEPFSVIVSTTVDKCTYLLGSISKDARN